MEKVESVLESLERGWRDVERGGDVEGKNRVVMWKELGFGG